MSRFFFIIVALALVGASTLLSAGAALAQAPAFTPRDENPQDFPDHPGRDQTFYGCTPCHGFKLVAQQGQSRAQWNDTLDFMTTRHNMPKLEGGDRKVAEHTPVQPFIRHLTWGPMVFLAGMTCETLPTLREQYTDILVRAGTLWTVIPSYLVAVIPTVALACGVILTIETVARYSGGDPINLFGIAFQAKSLAGVGAYFDGGFTLRATV